MGVSGLALCSAGNQLPVRWVRRGITSVASNSIERHQTEGCSNTCLLSLIEASDHGPRSSSHISSSGRYRTPTSTQTKIPSDLKQIREHRPCLRVWKPTPQRCRQPDPLWSLQWFSLRQQGGAVRPNSLRLPRHNSGIAGVANKQGSARRTADRQ